MSTGRNVPIWCASSRSGVVLVAQTAIRFLALSYLTKLGYQLITLFNMLHHVSETSFLLHCINLIPPLTPLSLLPPFPLCLFHILFHYP